MGQELDRRAFLKASALGLTAGAAVPSAALAGHWPPPDPNNPPGHHGTPGEQTDEGDLPQPTELPDRPEPTVRTDHDRGDAIITRFQSNLEANDFGCWGDTRSGLIYVTQRASDRIAIFDRATERFVDLRYVPTDGSGAHTIKVDEPNNRVWFAMGEASKIGSLVLDETTYLPTNFVEYTVPGDVRTERKPHGMVVVGDAVWYTDDRQDRTGWLDVNTGRVYVLPEHIESDGINVEDRRSLASDVDDDRDRRRRRRRRRRHRRGARGAPRFTGKAQTGEERAGPGILRIWVGGGNQVTVIDARTKRILHRVPVAEEPGFTQLRVHDIHYHRPSNRTFVLLRGSDHVVWFDADHPEAGPQEFINPVEPAAGLDHLDIGENYVWWTEGRSNNIGRYDLRTGQTVGYKAPLPLGYFNPHGIYVEPRWREVWFTEREALCRLRFKDGRQV